MPNSSARARDWLMDLVSLSGFARRWKITSYIGARANHLSTRWALDFMSAFGILLRGSAVQGRARPAHRAVQPVSTARTWAADANLPGYKRLWSSF
jgi:hypothetical protein